MSDQDDEILGKAYDARLARRLARYLRPLVGACIAAILLTLAATLLLAATPYLLGLAIDAGVVKRDADKLVTIGWWFVGVEAARYSILYVQAYVLTYIGQRVTLDLRLELFDHLVHQSMSFYGRQPAGRLVTRVINDVGAIAELFSAGVVAVLADVLTIVVVAVILVHLEWRLALYVLAIVPPLALAMNVLNAKIRWTFRDLRKLQARLNAYFAESLSGVRVVQIFGREDETQRRFEGRAQEALDVQLVSVHWHALYASIVTILTSGAVALIIWRGGGLSLSGALEVGVLVSFIGYAQQLFQPVRDIADKYAIFQAAMASAERIFQLLDEPFDVPRSAVDTPAFPVPASPGDAAPLSIVGDIEFRDVSFRYPRAQREGEAGEPAAWALRNVSFRVKPGERVAIVGHTGAGKSTIVNLLGRFYDVTEGAVLVDGRDVRTFDTRELRRQIGIVLQDVFVFAGSVLENIGLGDPRITPEDARRAAEHVQADRWIRRLAHGYDEEMRERGATISSGEKQLLSFARALAFDPRVLVLDEATASVDPETEGLLQSAIRTLTHGRTSIVIAHRLATIQDVDRVLVFHRGELREEGSVPELLARGGLFAALYRLQYPEAPAGADASPSRPERSEAGRG